MTALTRSLVVGGAVIAVLLSSGVAQAATAAAAARASAASSAKWSATLVDGGTLLTGRAFTANGSLLGPVARNFTSRNTGTLALTGQVFTIAASGVSLGSMSLTACTTGPWDGGSCSGPTLAIQSGVDAALAVPVGEEVGLRMVLPAGLGISASVSVSTSRANVRPATTTNS
ncbi:hypothetical protein ACFPM7_14630 [Actinokineospora guangxiensis]|uniref:Uncharacterized protein n=1 Tax=Actinokineospora guangxiensis TaxID=1490288 RepID=A0ABW0ELH8_9PSEU